MHNLAASPKSQCARRRMPRASDGTKASGTEQLIRERPSVIYLSMQICKQPHDTHKHRATANGAEGPVLSSPRRRLHHFRRDNCHDQR
ncbi:hypothetical protein BD410DRAFT_216683 [Rickenella mellea]|uniref:Uncharacterized protein n=1 Tax=Rickenella mellea TaxID=50990 RepID=A0A4Y7QL10_9AGAM|nr:hypothetical protein BD410DRAFT_216683 [Rickenella mellea]